MSTALPVLLFRTFVLYLTLGQWNLIIYGEIQGLAFHGIIGMASAEPRISVRYFTFSFP
jgi:hypothetical protein